MDNPGLPQSLWATLDDRLWHATGIEGFVRILRDCEIRVMRGRYSDSLCKMLDGVSLMDFGSSAIDYPYQFNNWWGWFGHQQNSRVAIWLEIDRRAVTQALLNAGATRAIWRDNLSRQIIPGVEACHKGAIPLSSIKGGLLIDRHDLGVFEWFEMEDARSDLLAKFEDQLPPPPPESDLLKAILASME